MTSTKRKWTCSLVMDEVHLSALSVMIGVIGALLRDDLERGAEGMGLLSEIHQENPDAILSLMLKMKKLVEESEDRLDTHGEDVAHRAVMVMRASGEVC
jgi:hypothetical protein